MKLRCKNCELYSANKKDRYKNYGYCNMQLIHVSPNDDFCCMGRVSQRSLRRNNH